MERNNELSYIYMKYNGVTNMSYYELLSWSKNPCSKKASLNRKPIKRNLRLLKKPKNKWNKKDIRDAKRTISYLARAKKIKSSNSIKDCGYTRNEIALKNWAYDTKK